MDSVLKSFAKPGDLVRVDRLYEGVMESFEDIVTEVWITIEGDKVSSPRYYFLNNDDSAPEHAIKGIVVAHAIQHQFESPKYTEGDWLLIKQQVGFKENTFVDKVRFREVFLNQNGCNVRYYLAGARHDFAHDDEVIDKLVPSTITEVAERLRHEDSIVNSN